MLVTGMEHQRHVQFPRQAIEPVETTQGGINTLDRRVHLDQPATGLGTTFQFRATGNKPLEIVITTRPPWPGDHEAVRVHGKWAPSV